jgi:hypothetical protein
MRTSKAPRRRGIPGLALATALLGCAGGQGAGSGERVVEAVPRRAPLDQGDERSQPHRAVRVVERAPDVEIETVVEALDGSKGQRSSASPPPGRPDLVAATIASAGSRQIHPAENDRIDPCDPPIPIVLLCSQSSSLWR